MTTPPPYGGPPAPPPAPDGGAQPVPAASAPNGLPREGDRTTSLTETVKRLPGRVSVRTRLTLTYALMFFVAGAVLLGVVYILIKPAVEAGLRFRVSFPPGIPREVTELWANEVDVQRQLLMDGILSGLVSRSIIALIGVGILAVIVGYFIADRALRPLQEMTATARRLSHSTLAHERINLQGPNDELKELADTFDAMLTRLNIAFDTQRRFVGNASHELRTPLAINRTVLEVAISDPEASDDLKVLGRTLLGTNARNERLIEGLLLLARSERELQVRKQVDVREVAETAIEQLAPFAAENSVTVSPELYQADSVGDPVLLERCAANLVENGIKHNLPEGGQVWVRVGGSEGEVLLQVSNTGPHVPAYEVDDLFEPFRRLNADRVDSARGAGLGLSIVRAVVRAHGGTVTAIPRPGGGLVVTVRLPRS
ncbi:sensor histidine kinase [Rhizohabitans arisaemae]|uniref:sensor histidine kinase n=1 Tax=Rhizohabitans arisaemae TaxID=2720610 RepID=UPI0024B05FFF|nr:HAMP domain-containing sensor histidine kinase [Rhizohabitans arisaemae]